jgi:hypothetical protein
VLLSLVLAGTAATGAFAEEFDSPTFQPVTAEVLAQGNSFTAVSRGYNALWTNPAGLARSGGSFTLLTLQPTAYFFPSDENVDALSSIADDPEGAISSASDLILDNGLGVSSDLGAIGIAGRRFGLALASDVDIYGRGGITALGTTVDVASTIGLVGGFAWPFSIGGDTLNVGGTVKILRRSEVRDLGLLDLLEAANSESGDSTIQIPVYSGAGIGFDIGALYERGNWSAGLSFRDVFGTGFAYSVSETLDPNQLGDVLAGEAGSGSVSDRYRIPMSMNIGAAWDPQPSGVLGFFFDPMVHFDYQNVFFAERDPSFWTKVHFGTEITTFRFLKARAGLNQGYGTLGLGAHLLFLDLNIAYYTRELGENVGSAPNQALAMEVAIRF